MPVFVGRDGVGEDLDGERRDGLRHARAEVAVVERCEERRRGFAGHTRQRQHDTGDDAGRSRRQHDTEDRPRTRCAERQRTSRIVPGTRTSSSWWSLAMIGIIADAEESPPANALNCLNGSTATP